MRREGRQTQAKVAERRARAEATAEVVAEAELLDAVIEDEEARQAELLEKKLAERFICEEPDEDLLEYMLQAGDVVEAKVMSHPDGRSKVTTAHPGTHTRTHTTRRARRAAMQPFDATPPMLP